MQAISHERVDTVIDSLLRHPGHNACMSKDPGSTFQGPSHPGTTGTLHGASNPAQPNISASFIVRAMVTNSSFLCQPVLNPLPNLPLLLCHFLLLSIISYNTGLVERVFLALLKLFLTQLYPLVLAQPRMLDLNLR
jgi:hypothetical protein